LSESGCPGFEDFQDRDFVGCVRYWKSVHDH